MQIRCNRVIEIQISKHDWLNDTERVCRAWDHQFSQIIYDVQVGIQARVLRSKP